MDPVTVSIVVEWENVLLADAERARTMLRRLVPEAQAAIDQGLATDPIELLVCFDPEQVPAPALESSPALRHGLVQAPGAEYYELKNAGAREASGELIVFVDSDVVPEPGWLANLLRPFADEAVQIVAGHSYLDASGLYGKTFALFWFFPFRATDARVEPTGRFFANNVAFRRELFEQFPFPAGAGTSRRACEQLAIALAENGVQILETTAAQVAHPPPNGLRHFVAHALVDGRDRVLVDRARGMRRPRSLVRAAQRLGRDLRKASGAVTRDFRSVDLPARSVPAAVAISTSYVLLCSLGEVAAVVNPRFMARHFRI